MTPERKHSSPVNPRGLWGETEGLCPWAGVGEKERLYPWTEEREGAVPLERL